MAEYFTGQTGIFKRAKGHAPKNVLNETKTAAWQTEQEAAYNNSQKQSRRRSNRGGSDEAEAPTKKRARKPASLADSGAVAAYEYDE